MGDRSQVVCPAGEKTRGTMSRNRFDVRCHVAGHLVPPSDNEGNPPPCLECYEECPIWKSHRDGELEEARRRRSSPDLVSAGNWPT